MSLLGAIAILVFGAVCFVVGIFVERKNHSRTDRAVSAAQAIRNELKKVRGSGEK